MVPGVPGGLNKLPIWEVGNRRPPASLVAQGGKCPLSYGLLVDLAFAEAEQHAPSHFGPAHCLTEKVRNRQIAARLSRSRKAEKSGCFRQVSPS
jgi:hypothetical protein